MDQIYQLKLALLRKAAVAADAVVKSHTPGTVPSATSEQMKLAKTYMTMAVPGFILHLFDEIDRLTHERNTLGQAIGEAVVKAGIAAAGMPFDGPQLLMLVDDLAESALQIDKDAERHRFGRDLCINLELQEALDPHMGWMDDIEEPKTAEDHNAMVDRGVQTAKDNGLWPIKVEPELTDEAQADRDEFVSMSEGRGCSCHISPPCGHCTHPGNPINQAEDPACWKVQP